MKKTFTLLVIASVITIASKGQTKILVEDAYKHVGETVTICDKIYSIELPQNVKNQPALNVGKAVPKRKVSVFLTYEALQKLTDKGKTQIINKSVCVTGKVVEHKGQPEIVVNNGEDIYIIKDAGGVTEIKPNDFMKFE